MSHERVVVKGMKYVDPAPSADIAFSGWKLTGDVGVLSRLRADIDEFMKCKFFILDCTSGTQNIHGMEQP